jgi:octaprenyl-diphosphate synthase
MADLHQISSPIERELSGCVELYDNILSHSDDLLGKILEHVRSRKGKMMRPILVLLSAREHSEVNNDTYNVALSLELFHNASLLHDDVVDESDERRGLKSVNAKFGNKLAVLVGDYMLSQALQQAVATGKIPIVNRISQLGILLSEGEVKQQANIRNKTISEDIYFDVIRNKTAELFSACGELGAFSVGASTQDVLKAKRLGEIIGMCFQIRDDIFDYYDNHDIGKPTGNDMLEGKLTLPAIYVLNNSDDRSVHDVAKRIKEGSASPDEISNFVEFVKQNGGISYAYEVIDRFRNEAYEILSTYRNHEVREALRSYVDFVVSRDK